MKLRVVIAIAITAAAVRLIPLQWLHPVNWDELEFFAATKWIAEGKLPYRDFWEHHTPLVWFVFAPFAALVDSIGVSAIVAMRWAQVPVWIATFWLANVWMRGAGLSAFARWSAMAFALCSSMLMIAAVEYRVDPLACALFMAGLVLVQRERGLLAGVVFCLAAWANLRLAPLIAVTVLLMLLVGGRRYGASRLAVGGEAADHRLPPTAYRLLIPSGLATLIVTLLFFVATGSFDELWQQVVLDNTAVKFADPVLGGFFHRLLVPFGVRIIASDRLFELAAVDVGGIAVLLLGFTGLVVALRRWRERDDLVLIAALQVASLIVLASMKFIYNYHFEIVIVLMLPLMAAVIERIPRHGLVVAAVAFAFCVSAFASLFRGKELDLAYQDLVMREVHRRTAPGEKVFGGNVWALQREPAYRFWFLPDLTRQLVKQRLAPPYVIDEPPAAVVFDHNALVWVANVQRELAPFFVRHYLPVWRNLWVPGMNALVRPGQRVEWLVPRDGAYRLFASEALANHLWFRNPIYAGAYDNADPRVTLRLPAPASHPALAWSREPGVLRKGERIAVTNRGNATLGVILLPGDDTLLFRQPPPGATLEAASTRVTHVPDFGARIE